MLWSNNEHNSGSLARIWAFLWIICDTFAERSSWTRNVVVFNIWLQVTQRLWPQIKVPPISCSLILLWTRKLLRSGGLQYAVIMLWSNNEHNSGSLARIWAFLWIICDTFAERSSWTRNVVVFNIWLQVTQRLWPQIKVPPISCSLILLWTRKLLRSGGLQYAVIMLWSNNEPNSGSLARIWAFLWIICDTFAERSSWTRNVVVFNIWLQVTQRLWPQIKVPPISCSLILLWTRKLLRSGGLQYAVIMLWSNNEHNSGSLARIWAFLWIICDTFAERSSWTRNVVVFNIWLQVTQRLWPQIKVPPISCSLILLWTRKLLRSGGLQYAVIMLWSNNEPNSGSLARIWAFLWIICDTFAERSSWTRNVVVFNIWLQVTQRLWPQIKVPPISCSLILLWTRKLLRSGGLQYAVIMLWSNNEPNSGSLARIWAFLWIICDTFAERSSWTRNVVVFNIWLQVTQRLWPQIKVPPISCSLILLWTRKLLRSGGLQYAVIMLWSNNEHNSGSLARIWAFLWIICDTFAERSSWTRNVVVFNIWLQVTQRLWPQIKVPPISCSLILLWTRKLLRSGGLQYAVIMLWSNNEPNSGSLARIWAFLWIICDTSSD